MAFNLRAVPILFPFSGKCDYSLIKVLVVVFAHKFSPAVRFLKKMSCYTSSCKNTVHAQLLYILCYLPSCFFLKVKLTDYFLNCSFLTLPGLRRMWSRDKISLSNPFSFSSPSVTTLSSAEEILPPFLSRVGQG